MKKLLLFLALAAAGLQGWAEKYPNELYAIGGATSAGWTLDDALILTKVAEKKYEGFVTFTGTADSELKFLCQRAFQDHWGPSSNGTSVSGNGTYNLSFCSGGSPDNKFKPTISGLYLVTIDLTTQGSETATFKKWETNSVYEIGNLGQLKIFANYVNNYDPTINAKLTADITDAMDYAIGWYDNGSSNMLYSGEFDGQGHTVTLGINDSDHSKKGLFGAAKGGANIHDVVVAGYVTGQAKVAGIIGYADGGGTIKLTNVINTATIHSTGNTDANAAGLVGCAVNNTKITAKNCANTGAVSGQDGQCAAFAGWTQSGTTFTNCWNVGAISDIESSAQLYRNSGAVTATNCFDLTDTGNQGTKLDASTLGSGELCYTLNGDQTSIQWFQNLSGTVDATPVPFSSHAQVYAIGELKCDGTSAGGDLEYSNTSSSTIPPHTFNSGWCSVCGALDHDYLTADGEGYYSIGNVNDLRWFAAYAENVNCGANAKLTSDIATYSGPYIGNSEVTSFSGTFDGQGHKITVSFTTEESKIGLFRCVKNGTIQNLIVDGTISAGNNNLMGGLVNESRESSTYRNIIVAVDMTATHSGDGTHGGVISVAWGAPTIENVAFVGTINAENDYGTCGIIGYAHNGGNITYRNCYVSGTLTLTGTNNRVFGRNGEYCVNCYTTLDMTTLNNSERFDGGVVTSAQVESGELCYLLNSSTCYDAKWFQNLSGTTDSYPVPFNTHGIVNKISSVGYTTQFIDNTDVTIPAGVKAYAGVKNDGWLSLREIKDAISKEDAVILKGTANTYYSFVPTDGAEPYDGNSLQGSDGTIDGDGENYYALSTIGGTVEIGFYLVGNGVTIPEGRAYLVDDTPGDGTGNVKGFTFVFEDDATSIESLTPALSEGEGAIYNVAGQRVSRMQKGINIVNGKKVLY